MPETATGVLKRYKNKTLLLDPGQSFEIHKDNIQVPEKLVKQYKITDGASIVGTVRKNKQNRTLVYIDTICGVRPEEFKKRTPYTRLTAITPDRRFNLSVTGDPSMRVVDLMAPIARGTRGLIVSPPRAGKTILLEKIARAIYADDPKTRIIALLVDERPEEVTHFRRELDAEVLASSNDMDIKAHIDLTETVMANVISELECGKDVVVLTDSLTRMARAFNLKGSNQQKGRTMSGGLQAGALEVPRRFFGLARNIENGGSVTIIATVLVDTGSRMDQLIFEEFKGTGNNEIVLDRSIAEARVFPAINLPASGTRREELLYQPHEIKRITQLRRALSKVKPKEGMELFLKYLEKYPTNEDMFNAELKKKN